MRIERSMSAAVSNRVNAERIVLIGWLRALLLQIAHPLIAAGVSDHSSFRADTAASVARLRQTVAAMLAITFGGPEDRDQALEGIRSIHRRVHGTLSRGCGVFPAGTCYSAEDSDLLVWVHATLAESILIVYDRLVAPLSAAERDRYCADSADVAIELGARPDAIPRSWPALGRYLQERYDAGHVTVSADARVLASTLLSPTRRPIARQIVTPVLSLLAAGLLPAHLRRQYRLPWNHRRERHFARLMQMLQLLRRIAPARMAHWKCARSANCLMTNVATRSGTSGIGDARYH